MLTYDMYRYIFLGALAACVVFFVIAVILFFVLRIPKVISDLSGRTERKAVENIRRQNEQSGDKTYQSSAVNLARGKVTDKISKSGRLIRRAETPFGTGTITEKISTQELVDTGATDVLGDSGATEVLSDAGATEVLGDAGATEVLSNAGATEVLSDAGATEVLSPAAAPVYAAPQMPVFTLEYDMVFIHTNETIV